MGSYLLPRFSLYVIAACILVGCGHRNAYTTGGLRFSKKPGMPPLFAAGTTAGKPLSAGLQGMRIASQDGFLSVEPVYVRLNTLKTARPPSQFQGQAEHTVDVYIVKHRSITPSKALQDVSGKAERVSMAQLAQGVLAWGSPILGEYDVVVDVNRDGRFSPRIDIYDGIIRPGFYVSRVRVESISFTGPGLSGFTIYDNTNVTLIDAPQYSRQHIKNSPCLGVQGHDMAMDVAFRAEPTVTSCTLQGKHQVLQTDQVAVAFEKGLGLARFRIPSLPSSVGTHRFNWNWQLTRMNGVDANATIDRTGEHLLYVVFGAPIAPLEIPWLEVLEILAPWVKGVQSEEEALSKITTAMFTEFAYFRYAHWTSTLPGFPLSELLESYRNRKTNGGYTQMDCNAFARTFAVFCRTLGIGEVEIRRIRSQINANDTIQYKPLLPAPGTGTTQGGSWNYHCVCVYSGNVIDASSKLGGIALAKGDISILDYLHLLTDDDNIKFFPQLPNELWEVH